MCQINNYAPLELEKYYQSILPTFHLLRRTDGSKYQSNSIKTVRSAMLSNKLFYKNEDGLYVLNIQNAINLIKEIQKKKLLGENDLINTDFKDKEENYKKSKNDYKKMIGKKRKLKVIKDKGENKKKVQKYEKAFELFNNLLKISSNDQNLFSKLNFDVEYMVESSDLNEENPNTNKIIGMLTVFKFFKPFLEKSFNSYKIQEKIIQKIAELNSEVNYIEALQRADE